MKRLFVTLAAVGLCLAPLSAAATGVFHCTGNMNGLHFVFYGDGNSGGHMYVNNIQTAVLNTYRVNDISVRATIAGNTTNTEFVFNSAREKVYIELTGTSNEVCMARVRID
ncbi:MAG: hypothetical protein GY717_09925 [Rhodobacteraceae bacterium]|nr:hypothetical protein [Paracoccaceae bacterium]